MDTVTILTFAETFITAQLIFNNYLVKWKSVHV